MALIVFRCDPRSASGKGAISTWSAYKQLGVQELKDIECAIDWLCKQPGVDATRVGMSGGSYGGFMTAFAMTHSKRFAAGIASAPVTDWHNYDSIYTERYVGTPKENPKGYEATSVLRVARNLHGKLLLVHGLMDDNVHAQNSIALVDALQRANMTEAEWLACNRSAGWKSPPNAGLEASEVEGNCVLAKGGGEQPETLALVRSDCEPDSASLSGEPPSDWRSSDNLFTPLSSMFWSRYSR